MQTPVTQTTNLTDYARLGSLARLLQIRAEEREILKQYPELDAAANAVEGKQQQVTVTTPAIAHEQPAKAKKAAKRRGVEWTPERRKAFSEKMKKLTAQRLKAQQKAAKQEATNAASA
jgi:hypothetical protein